MTVDELAREIERLSPAERDELYHRLGVIDRSKMRGAEIRIDDWQGNDEESPRVTIEFADGTEETIDIIASVEANAVSIGHPAILRAIQRWTDAIEYENVLNLSTPYLPSRSEFVKIATRHLERLFEAVIRGAKSRRMSKELAVDFFIVKLSLHDDYEVLHKVWEWLGEKEIKSIRNTSQKLREIENRLHSHWFGDSRWGYSQFQESPCVRLQLSSWEKMDFEHYLRYLQSKLVTSVFYEDQEHLQGYLDFLKTKPDKKAMETYPSPPNFSSRSKLVPEACCLTKNQGFVKMVMSWHGGEAFVFGFDDGSYGRINVADALDILGIRSKKLRKDLATAFGLTHCVANLPGGDFLTKSRADIILEFLRSRAGERFLSRRNSAPAFTNAYDSWRFPLGKKSLQKYRAKSKQDVWQWRAEEQKRIGSDWIGDFGYWIRYKDRELFNHYPTLLTLAENYNGRVLLPTWFNEYKLHWDRDTASLPVKKLKSKSVD